MASSVTVFTDAASESAIVDVSSGPKRNAPGWVGNPQAEPSF